MKKVTIVLILALMLILIQVYTGSCKGEEHQPSLFSRDQGEKADGAIPGRPVAGLQDGKNDVPGRQNDEKQGNDGRQQGSHGRRDGGPLFTLLDANQDKTLSAGEMKNAAIVVKKYDTNGDSRLSVSEIEASRKAGKQQPQRGSGDDEPGERGFRNNRNSGGENAGRDHNGSDDTRSDARSFSGQPGQDESSGSKSSRDRGNPGNGRGTQGNARERRHDGGPLFVLLDANQDRTLSADEMNNAADVLKKYDTDGDGSWSAGEIEATKQAMKKGSQQGQQPGREKGRGPHGPGSFTMEQTLSDNAQLHTMAFDGIAFITGSLGADSFLPPGKVADFWGFQYLRDNDPDEMGHNTDFLSKAADNVLYILNDRQRAELVALAKKQVSPINEFAYKRFPLMKAFRRLIEGNIPAGARGLDKKAVMDYSAQLYLLDGRISLERARVMGGIIRSLDEKQRNYLDAMAAKGMRSWPEVERQRIEPRLSRDENVAVMTYAADLFSWYAGSPEKDTYFCPERQATCFGSFFLKDAPAMGKRNYTLGSNVTADMGRGFRQALTPAQAQKLSGLVDIQRSDLREIVSTRHAIAVELRRSMKTDTIDSARVMALMKKYGELDGAIVYHYATHFAAVAQSLTPEQKVRLKALRDRQLGDCRLEGAYLYSHPIAMPEIPGTDFLFGVK